MSERIVDYIIIGQGICGTFLSWNLIKAGNSVLVIDESTPNTASKLASGVINPITGRRMVRTWEIETIMPFAVEAYTNLGNELGINLIRQCNMMDFHATPQMKLAFENRLLTEKTYLKIPSNKETLFKLFNDFFGVGEIDPCWLININALLLGWRKELDETNSLLEEKFELSNCTISENQINYQSIQAKKIIFCDGVSGINNPYFNLLPYSSNKGEVIFAKIKDLPTTHIYKQGISLVPWKEDIFWIGSTYEWNYTNLNITTAFYQKVEQQLKYWLKLPFEILDHQVAERPTNLERRPFVGIHPIHQSVCILNGMGTKGCSLAPYFSHQLTELLLNKAPIHPLADIERFKNILSR